MSLTTSPIPEERTDVWEDFVKKQRAMYEDEQGRPKTIERLNRLEWEVSVIRHALRLMQESVKLHGEKQPTATMRCDNCAFMAVERGDIICRRYDKEFRMRKVDNFGYCEKHRAIK
jgi:hypothetical protein